MEPSSSWKEKHGQHSCPSKGEIQAVPPNDVSTVGGLKSPYSVGGHDKKTTSLSAPPQSSGTVENLWMGTGRHEGDLYD